MFIKKISRLCFFLTCLGSFCAEAQYDSAYIESYDGYLVGRVLANRKYTRMTLHNRKEDYRLNYTPNKTFTVGLGATYRFATLNLSLGVMQPNPERGKTRDLDIQINRYSRKFATDLLLQFYKGFYLPEKSYAISGEQYYTRPDLRVNAIGGSFHYVLNHRKFSYRAAFQQTEVQKKPAGSFLLGAELYVGRFRGDSTIVPGQVIREGVAESTRMMRFIEIGPNAGYAYTFVYNNFFVTGAASVSLNAGISRFYDDEGTSTVIGLSPNTLVRISTGYNSSRWGVNVLFISTALHFPKFDDRNINVNTGRYRMNLIYRIWPDKKTRRYLRVIDKIDKKLKG